MRGAAAATDITADYSLRLEFYAKDWRKKVSMR
jgi:hypothetical protein